MSRVVLSSIIDIISGGTPKTNELKYWEGGSIGWLSINDFNNDNRYVYVSEKKITELAVKESNTKLLERNDIIISARGTVGVLSQIGTPMCFNQSCFGIRGKKGVVDNTFLYYSLKNYISNIKKRSQGSVFDTINLNTFDLMEIDIPNINRQQRIASVLSSLDDKIEFNNRINAELETMAKTLYDYWFVQFDFPDTNGKPYKSSDGKMVYNQELKREIPEGWKVGKIVDWIASDKSGDWGKEQEEGNYTLKVSCIRGADINGLNGKGDLNPPERYILEKNTSKILNPYDLIIEISGGSPTQSTGRMAYITSETLTRFENPLIYSNFCKAISLKNCKYLYNFAFLWNVLYHNKVFFGFEGKTSGIKNFLFESFVNSYWSVIPDEKIVLEFYVLMQNIEKKKQKLLAENQQLASLRDWLLPMLMNGQVGFKEEYQEQSQVVNVAVGAKAEDKTGNKKYDSYHKIQSVYAILWANSLVGVRQGEMATAKDLYLIDKIAQVNTGFTYVQHNWGSFDPVFKITINNKQYFTRRNFPNSKAYYCDTADNGYLLNKIPEEIKEKIKSSIIELHNKIFVNYFGKQKAEMKELYATILKCIEDTQSTNFSVIRQAMKEWKTPKQDFPDKATKFSEQRTKEALDVIVKEGWDRKIIKG